MKDGSLKKTILKYSLIFAFLIGILLLIFMVMFWIFRLVVAFTASIGVDIGFAPMNLNLEIILSSDTLPFILEDLVISTPSL